MSIQVSVYDPTLELIAHVPSAQNVQFSDEINSPGAFSMTLPVEDPLLTLHPSLLNRGRVVTISTLGVKRRSYVIEGRRVTYGADGAAKNIAVDGRGVLCLLDHARLYPESPGTSGGIRWDQADERAFDYGSLDGPWRVTAEWDTPVGLRWDDSSSIRKGLPARWPDKQAEWLWVTNPNAATPPQYCYFRGGFTLTSPTRVKIFAQGDERMRFKLDGEEIFVKGSRWWDLNVYTTTLEAGYHLLAARVQALQHEGANNPAAFICSVARVDRNGKILSWIKRSVPTGFQVRQLLPGGTIVGWYGASIVKLIVNEGKERNVHMFDPITFGFSDTVDSDGVAHSKRYDMSFPLGTRYSDVLARLVENGMDVDMGPELELNLWNTRGTDLTGPVQLVVPTSPAGYAVDANESNLRNRALIRGRSGWLQYNDATSETANGRREEMLTLGGALSDQQAEAVAESALEASKDPEVTLEATVSSARGHQPFDYFNVGDTVTAVTEGAVKTPARVVGIAGSENDTGEVTYTIKLYPVT